MSSIFKTGGQGRPPPLQAQACDLLDVSGAVDPTNDQPREVRSLLSAPSLLFPDLQSGSITADPIARRDKAGYAKLVARQIRACKVVLSGSCDAAAGIFTVGKASGALREVWNGAALSERAVRPFKPPHLANPSPLLHLEAGVGEPIHVYKRDARCYFDQLSTPAEVRRWLGRPRLCCADLLRHTDLSWKELEGAWVDSTPLGPDSYIHPLCATWPMGFPWSSYLAQSTLLGCCRRAGLGPERMLALDLPTPADLTSVVALATDDVALFVQGGRRRGDELIHKVDLAIASRGIVKHEGKDVDYQDDATVIGVDLRQGRLLCPELKKLTKVLAALVHLLVSDMSVAPLELAELDGQLAWFALLNRPVFATLHVVYELSRVATTVRAVLPAEARAELWLFCALLTWVVGDLARPWQRHLVASDASPSYGFGVSATVAPPGVIQEIARSAARPATFVRLDRDLTDPSEEPNKPRLGTGVKIPLRKSAFRSVLSSRAKHQAHAGTLEAEAVTLALRWVLRSTERHGRRTVLLIDAQAVLGAIARGRSSAPSLRRAVMRTAAYAIGGDLLLHLIYVPSEDNPADAPSRGVGGRRRAAVTPVASKWKPRVRQLAARASTRQTFLKRSNGAEHRHQHLRHTMWECGVPSS